MALKRGLKLGRYPYTATRVRAMKSLLLKRDDYARMEKMGFNELIKFLEDHGYKKEINETASEYSGLQLLELALNENLANNVNKVIRISIKKELRNLVELYARKWVANNIKIVLRARINGLGMEEVKYGIIPVMPADYAVSYTHLTLPTKA